MPANPRTSPPRPAWPFPTKDPSQYRRVDQGWDLQYGGQHSVPVYAVLSGRLRNAGPDPAGFGPGYPLLILDAPLFGYPAIYYGHTFTDMSKVGRRVAKGETIGRTGYPHSGGNAYPDPNWLEIGFWDNGPAAGGQPGASVPGAQMKAWLLGASSIPGGPPGPPVAVSGPGPAHPPVVVAVVTAAMFLAAGALLVAGSVAVGAAVVRLVSQHG
jgi:hypothetical protein